MSASDSYATERAKIGDSYATERPVHPGAVPDVTGWVGLIVFGGIMMFLLGLFHLVEGLVALADDDFYVARPAGLAVAMSYTAWGWIHVIVGVIALATAVGIFLGQMWARVVGVVIAVVSALSSMAFLAAYPLWSVILIGFDVLVIYALVTHGREVRD